MKVDNCLENYEFERFLLSKNHGMLGQSYRALINKGIVRMLEEVKE